MGAAEDMTMRTGGSKEKAGVLVSLLGAPLAVVASVGCAATPSASDVAGRVVPAAVMRDNWVLEGQAELKAADDRTLEIMATGGMALWCPVVYQGKVTVEFDCLMKEPYTKCLVFVHGHGWDGAPIWTWERTGHYDGYNAGRMEVYTIGFNRGPHVSERPGDQLCNVRRIGGRDFACYTAEAYREARKTKGGVGALRRKWQQHSVIGGALEPDRGLNRFIRYRIEVDPPWIRLWVNGQRFAEFVDQRPNPLTRGCVGFRCMKAPRTILIRNVTITGAAVAAKK